MQSDWSLQEEKDTHLFSLMENMGKLNFCEEGKRKKNYIIFNILQKERISTGSRKLLLRHDYTWKGQLKNGKPGCKQVEPADRS